MTELNEMTAAPYEWKIKGKVLKVATARLNDLGEFEAWVIQKWKKNMMEIADSLPPKEKGIFLLQAMREIPTGVELALLNSNEMVTIEGSRKFLHILIRKNNPEMTEQGLFDLITPDNLEEAQKIIEEMSGLTKFAKEKEKKENNENAKEETPVEEKKKKQTKE